MTRWLAGIVTFIPVALLPEAEENPVLALAVLALAFAAGWRLGRRPPGKGRKAGRHGAADAARCPALLDELQRCLADWHRREIPFSLLLIDLGGASTRAPGQGGRDRGPMAAAARAGLAEMLRTVDRLFEPGAGTIAVVMPGTGSAAAAQVVVRLEQYLAGALTSGHRTAPAGVPAFALAEVRPEDSVGSVLGRAREALVAAKQGTSHAVCFHDGDRVVPLTAVAAAPRSADAEPVMEAGMTP